MVAVAHTVGNGRPADSRQRLRAAAERLFAERGFSATSVRDITRAAGCNVAAVNYHFGHKRSLYREVFRHRLTEMREQRIESVRLAVRRSQPPALEWVLTEFTNAYVQPLVAAADGRIVTGLMNREMLDPHLPARVFREQVVEPVHAVLVDALIAAAPGLSPAKARLCVLSLVGQLIHAVHRHQNDRAAAHKAGPSLKAMVDHIVRFSAAGIRARARRPHQRKDSEI